MVDWLGTYSFRPEVEAQVPCAAMSSFVVPARRAASTPPLRSEWDLILSA